MSYPWLMHGDCLERMKEIADGSVDMILADLPYGTTACKWDVVIPLEPLWEQYWRVLKSNGVAAIFASQPFTTTLIGSQKNNYKYNWLWDKVKPSGFQLAKYQPLRRTEDICVFGRGKIKYNPQKIERIKPVKSKVYSSSKSNALEGGFSQDYSKIYEDKMPTSVLVYSNADNTNRQHPTQKPIPLLEYLIKTYTNEGEVILDNVMGSGSTGVACINTGRKFIGIEKDEKYFQIAEKRIADTQAKPPEIVEEKQNTQEYEHDSIWD